jgi:spore coat protein SA
MTVVHAGPANLELPPLRGGAVERRMVELAIAQAEVSGHKVLVYSPAREDRDVEYHGVIIRHLATPLELRSRELIFPLRIARDLRRVQPRIVHLHNRPEYALLLPRRQTTVLSYDYHFEPFHDRPPVAWAIRAVWKTALERIHRLAAVSNYCLGMHTRYWNCAPERYTVLTNGVDTSRFRPDRIAGCRWREKLGLQNRKVILYVGRVCEQKGTDLLVSAWAHWKRQIPGAALVLVGPADKFGNTTVNSILTALVRDGAMHLPPVDDSELPGVYNMADVFVMPTRRHEMFGMAAVEAQSCAVPVVASDQGGLRETVPDGAGIRFRPGDATDLALKVTELLLNADLRHHLAEKARNNAGTYDWARVARQCDAVYSQAANV